MMFTFKIKPFIMLQILFITFNATSAYTIERIILVGDSILDNSYWNSVGFNTTGQRLVSMLNSVDNIPLENGALTLIDDRSVEEATAEEIVNALDGDGYIKIPNAYLANNYIERRKRNGVAYNSTSPSSARLFQYCYIDEIEQMAKVDIKYDIRDSYVFISAGGNDFLLNFDYPFNIINNIKKIGSLYKSLGAKKVIYIIPYTMTSEVSLFGCFAINTFRYIFKKLYLENLTKEHYDEIIDLSDFDDSYRRAEYSIPEPTIKGAKEIAKRIMNTYKKMSTDK